MIEQLSFYKSLESNDVTNDNLYNNDFAQSTKNTIKEENNNKEQDNNATLAENNSKSE